MNGSALGSFLEDFQMNRRMVLVLVSGLAIGACSKRAGTSGSAATEGVDDVFRTDIGSDIPNFNFLIENELIQTTILSSVYEPLLDRDPETYEFTPVLAKSYVVAKDG